MFKDDWIYVSHMLDMSRKAVDAVTGKTRDGYWEIVTHDLPALIRGLEKIIPSEY
jgi:hypothetical protein